MDAPTPPPPFLSLTFIPISTDMRLRRTSAPQLLRVQEPPVSPAEPLQPEGEEQPALPFTQPSPAWLVAPQPAPSPCRTRWPTAFPSGRTELDVVYGGQGGGGDK